MRERRANKRLFLVNPLLDCISLLMPCELYAISLTSIKKTKHQSPPRIVIHGREKVGKSSVAASAPNPIFIPTEDGLNGIDAQAFPVCKSYQDVLDAIKALATESHEFKTVVIDSADWLETLIHDHICRLDGVSDISKASGGFHRGFGTAANVMKDLLGKLDDLNKRLGMIIIVICHSTVLQSKDPESESYDIATLKLHKAASAVLAEWGDVLGYARYPIIISKNTDGDFKARDKGLSVMNELIIGKSASCLSGNRYGLPTKIPLSWQAFEQAFAATNAQQAVPVVQQPATQSAAQTISN
jgi:hypothetical protein